MDRHAIITEIREEFARHFDGPDPAVACLYWSFYACRVFARHGIHAILQAGLAAWPCAKDDGVGPTHFAYEWDPHSAETRRRLAAGVMPELHVWVALPESVEIVDLTTGFLPEQARRMDMPWTAAPPPAFIWEDARALRERQIIYSPELRATAWALSRLGGVVQVVASAPREISARKPCDKCPFSRAIPPGDTGGADPALFIGQVVGPFMLPCHKDPGYKRDRRDPGLLQCAGAATFRSNIGIAAIMPAELLRCAPDHEAVFSSPAELLAHHERISVAEADAFLRSCPPEELRRRELEKVAAGMSYG